MAAQSSPAVFRGALAPMLDGDTYLGGGKVLSLAGSSLELELDDGGRASAQLALSFAYVPIEGDTLLVIGRGGRHFVIGVLETQGEIALQFPGDVRLHAERHLSLEADEGIELSSDELSVRVRTMRVVADTVVDRAGGGRVEHPL
jgi:hypothetical protein